MIARIAKVFASIARLFSLKPAAGVILALAFALMPIGPARAQQGDPESQINRPAPMISPEPGTADDGLPPIPHMRIQQPITGSMMVSPPYGNAPLKVGFFVLADDPENAGFLTYQWNFGDGTVSALPPELYIFHTYAKPGDYVCSLLIKTVDGRSRSFFQGVIVKPPAG
jgi:hypothetical protein